MHQIKRKKVRKDRYEPRKLIIHKYGPTEPELWIIPDYLRSKPTTCAEVTLRLLRLKGLFLPLITLLAPYHGSKTMWPVSLIKTNYWWKLDVKQSWGDTLVNTALSCLSLSLSGGHLLEVINRDYSDPWCGTHLGRGKIALPRCAGLFTLRLIHVIGLQRSAPTGGLVTSSRKCVWGKVGSSTSPRLIWHPTAGALGSGGNSHTGPWVD